MITPSLLVLCLMMCGSLVSGADLRPLSAVRGAAVVVGDAQQFDFKSESNGRDYRIYIASPPNFDVSKKYPVFYILDANYYFAAARDIVHYLASLPRPALAPAIIVGIGYPASTAEALRLRWYDLSPIKDETSPYPTGGGDEFIRLLLNDIKPFVNSRFKIDEKREAIFGKSAGGSIVLRILLRHTDAFTSYIAASPGIYRDGKAVLKDVNAFAERGRNSGLNTRVLISVGAAEEGRDMIKNASEFVQILTALDLNRLKVTHTSFPDENHESVSLPSLGRALRFALPPDAPVK